VAARTQLNDLRSAALYAEALRHIPGGVSSPVRAMRAVGREHPLFVAEAEGAFVTDADGNRYVDLVGSWGPMILGHAHPAVVEALQRVVASGTSFGAPTALETDLARAVKRVYPAIDLVRFVSSGTEASMSAVRLARGYTGRDRILKFAGCYHGHVDALLAQAGSGVATLGLPSTPGIPASVTADTIVVPFNDVPALEAAFDVHGPELACVLVEAVAGNMGTVPPEPGFLEAIAAGCRRVGALFVCDEVMTGFRLAPGGAVERFGLDPDLVVLGKILGGGLPAAAFGGRRDVMESLAPLGGVYQAGTLSGNPLAMTAGVVTLGLLAEPGTYERLEATSAAIEEALREAAGDELGQTVSINRVGSMLTLFFGGGPVRSFADAARCDVERYGRFFRHLLAEGVYLAPSAYEALFVSLAHGPDEVERIATAAASFFRSDRPAAGSAPVAS
jgi:glutamate-1-semialdehyde 2,1-aminomutase